MGSTQQVGLEKRDLQKERKEHLSFCRSKHRGSLDTLIIPVGEKKGGEEDDEMLEMVVGYEEMGNCSVDHVWVPNVGFAIAS